MAKIPDGSFKKWNNGETLRAEDWQQEREMLRVQGNNNFERIESLETASANLRLADNFAEPTTSAASYPLGNSVFKATGSTWNNYLGLSGAGIFIQTNKDTSGNAFQIIQSMHEEPRMFVRSIHEGAWLAPIEVPRMSDVQADKITADNGGVKLDIASSGDLLQAVLDAGVGLHTFYAAGGAKNLPPDGISVRGFAHVTSSNFGYILTIDYRNQVHTNYINGQYGWLGWQELTSTKQDTLWTGASYMHENQIITPTKKLSECRNGWILEWSDYVPGTGAKDYDYFYSYVPKWVVKGLWVYFDMPTFMNRTDGLKMTAKLLKFTDSAFNGHLDNGAPMPLNSEDVVLRRVLEW
jgi:hypothetical protein